MSRSFLTDAVLGAIVTFITGNTTRPITPMSPTTNASKINDEPEGSGIHSGILGTTAPNPLDGARPRTELTDRLVRNLHDGRVLDDLNLT